MLEAVGPIEPMVTLIAVKGCVYLSQDQFKTAALWYPTPKGKGAPRICRCSWLKGMMKVRVSTEAYKVLLVNYTWHENWCVNP